MEERHRMLSQVAAELRRARGDLIGAAAANTGKVFSEADVEVSEAIDFTEYYPYSARRFAEIKTIRAKGKGVGAVVSPWNFPIAIPCGGISAALAAGKHRYIQTGQRCGSGCMGAGPVLLACRHIEEHPAVCAVFRRQGRLSFGCSP